MTGARLRPAWWTSQFEWTSVRGANQFRGSQFTIPIFALFRMVQKEVTIHFWVASTPAGLIGLSLRESRTFRRAKGDNGLVSPANAKSERCLVESFHAGVTVQFQESWIKSLPRLLYS